jgi:RNA polymerase sigma factor (sigma-70 family)
MRKPMKQPKPVKSGALEDRRNLGLAMTADELLPTRHSLLRRLKDWDDQSSWEDFFNTYWRLIYCVAIKAGLNDTEAQDVVQETVMTVAKNIKDFEVGSEHGSFKTWLLTITRWRIVDQFRKRPPPAGPVERSPTESGQTGTTECIVDSASPDVDVVWDRDWEQNLMEVAMAKVQPHVNPVQYQMFQLQVVNQWPAHKVAEKLGVKLGKVYFAKYKVSRLIKKEVKRLQAEFF